MLGNVSRKVLLLFMVLCMSFFLMIGCEPDPDLKPTSFILTMQVDGEGSVNPPEGTHEYDKDAVVDLTATPSSGWEFKEWVGDVADKKSMETTVIIEEDKIITAVFEKEDDPKPTTYTLTMQVYGQGAVTPPVGSHTYDEQTEVNLTAIPSSGWEFKEWIGDVADAGSVSTSVLLNKNQTVTAFFIEIIPETKVYIGTGDDVIVIEPPDNQENYLVYIEGNQAERHFAVKGLDTNGNITHLFVNTTKQYEGLNLNSTGKTYYIEISADTDDPWKIEIRPIQEVTTIQPEGTYRNKGDYVFKIDEAINLVKITGNEEEKYFGIWAHDDSFVNRNLLVNTTTYYEGTVFISSDMRFFEVTAIGEWKFDFYF